MDVVGGFLQAAETMFGRGWTTHPLRKDANGLPKVPITMEWSSLPHDWSVIQGLAWDRAEGIGIVLGEPSGNLACLDIDDDELFSVVVAMQGFSAAPRLVRTARQRGHYYFSELTPSASTWREVAWRERTIKIELKANGTQVAAPPTPGYRLITHNPPQVIEDIHVAFAYLMDCLADYIPGQVQLVSNPSGAGGGSAGYPAPWAAEVHEDSRNNSAYIESHKLREASVPLEQALGIMAARFTAAYSKQGITWEEIEATVRSAYRKGVVQRYNEEGGSDFYAFSDG
jgi:hypothetical protein